ncbi:putative polysaccharide export protein [Zalerion maritima]|uniref:Polysaccharide export protein n=1 Tax=Zalerion maritima TaxID=339359 RepID=A0AAD5RZ35_9PEZI|nr:putative polysaccharide export protein [Zalerion maritima]
MLLPSFRRYRRQLRTLLSSLLLLLFLDAFMTVVSRPSTTYAPLSSTSSGQTNNMNPDQEKIFIVSVHRNTEKILRAHWNDAIISLAQYFGPQNVYFSAVESGSQDHTKDALAELRLRLLALGVGNEVVLGTTVKEQLRELDARPSAGGRREDGWIWNRFEERWDMRRIPYLSRVRNQAMEPLYRLLAGEGRKFDKVLWINDVAFDTRDIVTLLETRGGKYAAACSMDFKTPPFYYDTFALRDDEGNKAAGDRWPWFSSHEARWRAKRLKPTRVKSCWNGVVGFDAWPFYSVEPGKLPTWEEGAGEEEFEHWARAKNKRMAKDEAGGNTTDPERETEIHRYDSFGEHETTIAKRNQAATTPGTTHLEFRGVPDSLADLHLEGSECCLIHADNPLSDHPDYGVWLNPNVRVGYTVPAYEAVKGGTFPRKGMDAVWGVWSNRLWRMRGTVQVSLERWTVASRLARWKKEGLEGREERGDFCLINEMQIMWSNGWRHL